MTTISQIQYESVLHIVGILLAAAPFIRARSMYVELFRLRRLIFDDPELQQTLQDIRLELRRRAVTLDLPDYMFISGGFIVSIAGYGIRLF